MKNFISILSITLFISFTYPANAKNYVKIATIGAAAPQFEKGMAPQELVDNMIDFWENQLNQVLPDEPDLIVLPEACDRPRGLNIEEQFKYFEVRKNQVLDYFRSAAKDNQCYIAFGTKRQIEDGSWRNSCIILNRAGEIAGIYNKNFPTIGEMEAGIKAGKEAPVFQCDFGSIACAICFDLNFDELLRKYQETKPDIIIFPSMYHGGLVQSYWAYTTRAFFVSAGGFREFPSEIRNPLGDVIATTTNYFDFVVTTVNLDYRLVHLDYNWEKLRALKEKYGDKVTIYDPGKVGTVLITSEHNELSADEMIREFDIELLDDYFERSRTFRQKP
jgi:predicted amidohydrolase